MKRKAQRANKRVEPTCNEDRVQEQLCLPKLLVVWFSGLVCCLDVMNKIPIHLFIAPFMSEVKLFKFLA